MLRALTHPFETPMAFSMKPLWKNPGTASSIFPARDGRWEPLLFGPCELRETDMPAPVLWHSCD
jgi:hypothetical protein